MPNAESLLALSFSGCVLMIWVRRCAQELTLGLLGPESWINCSNEGTRSPLVYRRKSCCRANRVEHKARRVVFRCRQPPPRTPRSATIIIYNARRRTTGLGVFIRLIHPPVKERCVFTQTQHFNRVLFSIISRISPSHLVFMLRPRMTTAHKCYLRCSYVLVLVCVPYLLPLCLDRLWSSACGNQAARSNANKSEWSVEMRAAPLLKPLHARLMEMEIKEPCAILY